MSFGNTAKDGSGDAYWLLLDTDGRLNIVGAAAEDAAVAGNPILIGGRYDAAARTLDDGDAGAVALDAAGRLLVAGAAAEDAAVVGNPVLIGGRYDATPRDLDDGDVGAPALNVDAQVIVDDGWAPSLEVDEAADDSDKSFTVPANTRWRIQSIWVELTTTADAGDRQMGIDVLDDSSDVILQIRAGIVQAASVTRYYLFAPHVTELTAFRDTDQLTTIFPELELPAGYIVRVWDTDAIQAAADDMVVQMLLKARTV